MRRLVVIAAVVVLVTVGVWMTKKPIERFDLGRGELLVTRDGVDAILVGDGHGAWRRYTSRARDARDGLAAPGPVRGLPAIAADGSAWMLTDAGLVRLAADGSHAVRLAADELPPGAVLEGAPGDGPPILSAPVAGSDDRRLYVPSSEPEVNGTLSLAVVADAEGEAIVPAGAELVVSSGTRAVAFPRPPDWEAWRLDLPEGPARVVARDCPSPGALFTPNGEQLIVQGKVGGLYLLSLAKGTLKFMADDNLGLSRRVPFGVGVRRRPTPVLVGPQWSVDGYLNIYWTHLGGGGRQQFKMASLHHYDVALSWSGRLMVYCQADFDEHGDEPFDEALYAFDFSRSSEPAIFLDDRPGGRRDVGPAFVGHSDTLVYIAGGVVHGVVFPVLESEA